MAVRCGRHGAARRQARVATGDGREGEGRASGEAEPFFGQLDPGRAVEQVEEDEHALPRRQAALDDCGEAPERSARDGHRTAGDAPIDLDHSVRPGASPQVRDDLGPDACRRVSEYEEAEGPAAVGDRAQPDELRLTEDVAGEHRAYIPSHGRPWPLPQERQIGREPLSDEGSLNRAFLVALGLNHQPPAVTG